MTLSKKPFLRPIHRLRRSLTAILILAISGIARAEPIEITIPIDVQNMHPDVQSVMVFCYLLDEGGRHIPATASSPPQFLVDGAFAGDVVAKAHGDPSIADAAHSYLCFMQFAIRGAPGVHRPGPVPTTTWNPSEYVRDRLQSADGVNFTYYHQGTF